jgi:hypothetical protein
MCSLANFTPPENTVCFFHALEKANPPTRGFAFLEPLKKQKHQQGLPPTPGEQDVWAAFSTLLLQTLKSTILSNPPEPQARLQHIVFFSSSELAEVTNHL